MLRRFCLGAGLRAARATGSDRKTVAKYVAAAIAAGLRRGDAGRRASGCGRPRRASAADRPTRTWRQSSRPSTPSLWAGQATSRTVSRLTASRSRRGWRRSRLRRSEHHRPRGRPPPGEAAEIDFGLLGLWLDSDRGQRRRGHGLLVTLCYSRCAFLWIRLRQDLSAVPDGLEADWVFFGGVVKRLVEDSPRRGPPDRLAMLRGVGLLGFLRRPASESGILCRD